MLVKKIQILRQMEPRRTTQPAKGGAWQSSPQANVRPPCHNAIGGAEFRDPIRKRLRGAAILRVVLSCVVFVMP
jgi:hypothetical protein